MHKEEPKLNRARNCVTSRFDRGNHRSEVAHLSSQRPTVPRQPAPKHVG